MTALCRLLALFRRRERNGGWTKQQAKRLAVSMVNTEPRSALK